MAKKSSKVTREMTCAYLYADGSLVEHFDERRDGVILGTTVDVTIGFAPNIIFTHTEIADNGDRQRVQATGGRLIISRDNFGCLPLLKGAFVRCLNPSVSNGSPNSKALGLKVGYVLVTCKGGSSLSWQFLDGVLSSDFTIQIDPEYTKALTADYWIGQLWGYGSRINKITDLRPKVAEAA